MCCLGTCCVGFPSQFPGMCVLQLGGFFFNTSFKIVLFLFSFVSTYMVLDYIKMFSLKYVMLFQHVPPYTTLPYPHFHSSPVPPFSFVPFDSFVFTLMLCVCVVCSSQMEAIMWYVSSWEWLNLFNVLISSCIHFPADNRTLFFKAKVQSNCAHNHIFFTFVSAVRTLPKIGSGAQLLRICFNKHWCAKSLLLSFPLPPSSLSLHHLTCTISFPSASSCISLLSFLIHCTP